MIAEHGDQPGHREHADQFEHQAGDESSVDAEALRQPRHGEIAGHVAERHHREHRPYSADERFISVTTTCGAPPRKMKNVAEPNAADQQIAVKPAVAEQRAAIPAPSAGRLRAPPAAFPAHQHGPHSTAALITAMGGRSLPSRKPVSSRPPMNGATIGAITIAW